MKEDFSDYILEVTGAISIIDAKPIQLLWSGYGEISKLKLECDNPSSVIVKHISFPNKVNHPRGWNTGVSHTRKVRSYQVEFSWYQDFSKRCKSDARIANCFGNYVVNNDQVLILEDLDNAGYPKRKLSLSISEAKVCLKWLASFHATFMELSSAGLWEIGSYWHLGTRADEFNAMKAGKLKNAAFKLNDRLNQCEFQTIVHGDAKVANFCFAKDMKSTAMVDFQYTGRSCGMKDVVYFLGSCLNSNQCDKNENNLLDCYFTELKLALVRHENNLDFDLLEKEWRSMYAIAWTDFTRFLEGWMPTHSKLNNYSEKLLKESLSRILC